MNLNLFENRDKTSNVINKFIEELKNALTNMNNKNEDISQNETKLDEYNIYERKKVFLDNKSRKGNTIAWVMDEKSVCVSEHGDGGPFGIQEIDLPDDAKVRKCI